ncbi:TM252 protein, partial [Centropus bengalensis]|nr:TM252 protein [Centropus bengalensis]
LLFLSFSIISLGVLCISTRSPTYQCGNNKLVLYCLLAVGIFLLATGIFLSTFHEVLKYRGLSSLFIQNPWDKELLISTIDRPDFYPPSYEDSTYSEKQTFPLPVAFPLKQQELISSPPPLYSESSTEVVSETGEQEQPPPYEFSVPPLQHQQTADQDSRAEEESNSHPPTQENSY